jgi:mannose/cellobiose epimerase-like protein (N-acyl-D-glucosamine 2-epimerase family)
MLDENSDGGRVFFNPEWLRAQIFETIRFYDPQCMDQVNGGYYHCYLDDGTICDYETKPLVGTARFIYIFSMGTMLGGPRHWKAMAEHGLRFLEEVFHDHIYGGYYWQAEKRKLTDTGKYAYGQAFVLLALATAAKAGIGKTRPLIDELVQTLEKHLWDDAHQLYLDAASREWSATDPYRGQNANMHLCEAMIVAFEATGERSFLHRARALAHSVTVTLAGQTGGLVWEQYDHEWQPDWRQHAEYQNNEFRPFGFVLGHSIEWSKLLMKLHEYIREPWLVDRAAFLYRTAWKAAADPIYGGLYFSVAPDGRILDHYKYYWVMAEALGASARLAGGAPDAVFYLKHYRELFAYCWAHFIDHRYGAWYPKLGRANLRVIYEKSPLTKADYHPIANYYEAMHVFGNLLPDAFQFD